MASLLGLLTVGHDETGKARVIDSLDSLTTEDTVGNNGKHLLRAVLVDS